LPLNAGENPWRIILGPSVSVLLTPRFFFTVAFGLTFLVCVSLVTVVVQPKAAVDDFLTRMSGTEQLGIVGDSRCLLLVFLCSFGYLCNIIGGAEMVENLSCWYIKGWAVECLVLLP
jgi:hypothetical protein